MYVEGVEQSRCSFLLKSDCGRDSRLGVGDDRALLQQAEKPLADWRRRGRRHRGGGHDGTHEAEGGGGDRGGDGGGRRSRGASGGGDRRPPRDTEVAVTLRFRSIGRRWQWRL